MNAKPARQPVPSQADEIKDLYARGLHPWVIARIMDVSRKSVMAVLPVQSVHRRAMLSPEMCSVARSVLAKVAVLFKTTTGALATRRRFRPLPSARRVAALVLKQCNFSLRQIGLVLGGLTHSTVFAQLKDCSAEERECADNILRRLDFPGRNLEVYGEQG